MAECDHSGRWRWKGWRAEWEQLAISFWDEEPWVGPFWRFPPKGPGDGASPHSLPWTAEVTSVSPTPNTSQEESKPLSEQAAAPAAWPASISVPWLHLWLCVFLLHRRSLPIHPSNDLTCKTQFWGHILCKDIFPICNQSEDLFFILLNHLPQVSGCPEKWLSSSQGLEQRRPGSALPQRKEFQASLPWSLPWGPSGDRDHASFILYLLSLEGFLAQNTQHCWKNGELVKTVIHT